MELKPALSLAPHTFTCMGTEIAIKNFRSISDSRISLASPATLLVGGNGVGKTNLLYGIEMLARSIDGSFQETLQAEGGYDTNLYVGAEREPLSFGISLGKDRYEVSAQKNPDGGIVLEESAPVPATVREFLRNCRVYRFDTPVVAVGAVGSEPPVLASGGQNLVAVLGWMRENSRETYRALLREVRCVAPYVADFVLTGEDGNPDSQVLCWEHAETGRVFRCESLGAGVFKFVLLCAALMQPFPPKLLLLDDPSIGLDSLTTSLLCMLMHDFEANGGIVLVSTQSSRFVDGFTVGEVLLVEHGGGKGTVVSQPCEDSLVGFEDYNLGWLWESGILAPAPQNRVVPRTR